MRHVPVHGYEHWRHTARELLRAEVAPDALVWTPAEETQSSLDALFDSTPATPAPIPAGSARVPKEFLDLAPHVALHRDPDRWALLYRTLWRITHGSHELLQDEADPDVRRLRLMAKAVARDIHKMHAFVRFRKVDSAEGESYVAFHRPDHLIVEEAAPFFQRRFAAMRWAILTPDRSAYWDTKTLRFGPGVPASEAPVEDALEEMWRSYYAAVFNPARLKVKKMKADLPVRHWPTLPEAQIIPSLVRSAGQQVEQMIAAQPRSAAAFVPASRELPVLRAAAADCQGCDLYCHGVQTVFGDGPADSPVVFIGEQPGDMDDKLGRPFSGPAGKLLDRAFDDAGLDRSGLYITNTVKHFKFKEQGKRRIHDKANGGEINACRPWLDAELEAIRPRLIVCLGATAASAMLGRAVTISRERGVFRPHRQAESLLITMHPSAILRVPDPERQEIEYGRLVDDLKLVKAKLDEYRAMPKAS